MIVRRAIPADVPAILRMIVALAVYEREPDAVKATDASLMQSLFGDDPHVFAHVAELDCKVVGIAVWFLNYSTWTGRPGCAGRVGARRGRGWSEVFSSTLRTSS